MLKSLICLLRGHDKQEWGVFHFKDNALYTTLTRFYCKRCKAEIWQNSQGYTVSCPLDSYCLAPGDKEFIAQQAIHELEIE